MSGEIWAINLYSKLDPLSRNFISKVLILSLACKPLNFRESEIQSTQ